MLLNTAGYGYLVRDNQDRGTRRGQAGLLHQSDQLAYGDVCMESRPGGPSGYNRSATARFRRSKTTMHAIFWRSAWRTNPKPTLTNEVRAGGNIAPATFGYTPGVTPSPYLIGGTIYSTPDALASSPILPQGRNTRTYSIQDNATWTHGRHALKFGAFYQGDYVRTYDYSGTIPVDNVGIDSARIRRRICCPPPSFRASAPLQIEQRQSTAGVLAGLLDNAGQTFNVTSQTFGLRSRRAVFAPLHL